MAQRKEAMCTKTEKAYYVYMLRCRDDSLYVGITPDLLQRMKAHCGKISGGARYTRSHPVLALEAAWKTEHRTAAARMEYALKKLTHAQKLLLLSEPERICDTYVPRLNEYVYTAVSKPVLAACLKNAMEEAV